MAYRIPTAPAVASSGLMVLLAAVLAAAPAAAADKETRQLMADIRMLQEQAQVLQITLGSMTEALKALNKRLDEQAESSRKGFADQKMTVEALSNDLRIVREKVDDNSVRVGTLGQEVEALRQSVELLNAPAPIPTENPDAVAAPPADPGAPPVATPAPAPAAAPAAAIGMSPSRLYNEALADYSMARWQLAISGFRAFIASFPRAEQADDAQLHIGNSYLNDGKYESAIEAYDLAIRTYPKGNVVPDAYYKKGTAHAALRQSDRALEAFEVVIKSYPDSAAAPLASQRLQELKKEARD